jgi:hypothetical protein
MIASGLITPTMSVEDLGFPFSEYYLIQQQQQQQ